MTGENSAEARLREKLRKIEALFAGAGTAGEKAAAGAAADRIRALLGNAVGSEAPEEIRFSVPDIWSRKLFIALCRRYGISPFRYRRMHMQTVIVEAPRSFVDGILWPEFQELSSAPHRLSRRNHREAHPGRGSRRDAESRGSRRTKTSRALSAHVGPDVD